MSLVKYIKALENNEITPKQLVEVSIEKIKKNDAIINAVVEPRFEKALLEADQDFTNTVFKGIPILIKAIGQDLKGEASTGASNLLAKNIALKTDNFVQKIIDLGFIIIGQSNSPEFAFKNISDSRLYGDVRSPLDLSKTPGGSSGGAAAALLANYVPIVAASDGGGSIRIPASYGGLVGLKPTRGSMPTGPNSYRGWQGASMNFFLTKTIEDSELMFNLFKTNTIQSPFNYVALNDKKPKRLKIAYSLKSPVNSQVSIDAKQAINETIEKLKQLGHLVEEVTPQYDGFKLMESYYLVNGVETAAMIQQIEKLSKKEIVIDDIELVSWVLYQYGLSIKGYEVVSALNYWDKVSETMHEFLEDYDLFLTPTTAKTAPKYNETYQSETLLRKMKNIENLDDKYTIVWKMFEESLAYTPYTMLANITGQPAISLPLFKNEANEHLGVQFMAKKGEENLLFQISKQLLK